MGKPILLLIWLFTGGYLLAQPKKYNNQNNGGLCTSTIFLYKNNKYEKEEGCEASSHVQTGSWKQKKDTLLFTPDNIYKKVLIKNIYQTNDGTDKLTIKVVDSLGNNVTAYIKIFQKGLGVLQLDSLTNTATAQKADSSIIIITAFKKIFNQVIRISAAESNCFTITLNFANGIFLNSAADWMEYSFKLLKRGPKLISIFPDTLEDDKMIRSEYSPEK